MLPYENVSNIPTAYQHKFRPYIRQLIKSKPIISSTHDWIAKFRAKVGIVMNVTLILGHLSISKNVGKKLSVDQVVNQNQEKGLQREEAVNGK